jgi:hypothetical protein
LVAVKFVEDAEDDYVGLEVARYRFVQGGLVVFDGAWTKEGRCIREGDLAGWEFKENFVGHAAQPVGMIPLKIELDFCVEIPVERQAIFHRDEEGLTQGFSRTGWVDVEGTDRERGGGSEDVDNLGLDSWYVSKKAREAGVFLPCK